MGKKSIKFLFPEHFCCSLYNKTKPLANTTLKSYHTLKLCNIELIHIKNKPIHSFFWNVRVLQPEAVQCCGILLWHQDSESINMSEAVKYGKYIFLC